MVTVSNHFFATFYSKFRILGFDLYSTFPFHYSLNALYSTIHNLSYGRISTQTEKLKYSSL